MPCFSLTGPTSGSDAATMRDIGTVVRETWKGKETALETPHQSKEAMKATVTLGAAGAVKTMDFVRAVGPDAGKTMLAIYEFRGPDEYVIVFAPAGKDRPKEMDAKAGSGTTMHVWKRGK